MRVILAEGLFTPQEVYRLTDFDLDRTLDKLKDAVERGSVTGDITSENAKLLTLYIPIKEAKVTFQLSRLGKLIIKHPDNYKLTKAKSKLRPYIICSNWVPIDANQSPRSSVRGIVILDIAKPLVTMPPLDTSSLPASGWVCIEALNDSDVDYKGCLGNVTTEEGEFPLFDWEEYLRHPDTLRGAEPYKSFSFLAHERKRLYVHPKVRNAKITVKLKVGSRTIKKNLPLCARAREF